MFVYGRDKNKMTLNLEDSRADIIEKLEALIKQRLPVAESKIIKEFLAQYYLGVSPNDLREKSIEELYGALLAQWQFIYTRKPGESKIRVYNPQIEANGWQSVHTIIEIVQENKPFILDTIRLALKSLDINVRLIIHAEGIKITRNNVGKIVAINDLNSQNAIAEAPIFIEIDRQSDAKKLKEIQEKLTLVLNDVDMMVNDWQRMLNKLNDTITSLEAQQPATDQLIEIIVFLRWLMNGHFTFIGYAEYNFVGNTAEDMLMECIPGSTLGVLADKDPKTLSRSLHKMYPEAVTTLLNSETMLLGKTDTKATVHRLAFTDFVAIKFFDANAKVIKIVRFLGLYTATAYHDAILDIPYVRKKVERIFALAGFSKNSHDGNTLEYILSSMPRDELFQARDKELYDTAIGILHLQERQRLRLFMRRDIYGRYFSCLVYVSRELFNAQLRDKIQEILMQALHGNSVTVETQFSESVLARIHFVIRVDQLQIINVDPELLENKLVNAARTWNDDLRLALSEHYGEEKTNNLYKLYANAFPLSYKEIFPGSVAVVDIEYIEKLRQQHIDNHLEMSLYRLIEDENNSFRFKLFRYNKTIPLSDVVPILEKMGLRIISERPHEIKFADATTVWITDYRMVHPTITDIQPEEIKDSFQDAFAAVWGGEAEDDGFNKLVLSSKLDWRDISIFRAYYRYLWQTGLVFSQKNVEDALYNNADIAIKLIEYFYIKFNPTVEIVDRAGKLLELRKLININLDQVNSLTEDRIIRSLLVVLDSTIRTNFFQKVISGQHKKYLSFKFDSGKVPDLPLPKPMYEIFVYSTQVEAIHLRADMVARGGIRWSDRREDFRTEVLGLMKAQQVKNAVIVPLGSKGGFIVKKDLLTIVEREARNKIVIDCYKIFMCGLLDLTDNYVVGKIVKPSNTICWDKDDLYLVVAADKGTATFSDIANQISKEYNFWLRDAFASGGSTGYDHKKMAITARGAWESVKLHFKLLSIDVQKQPITVIGIGDMAGDVFGNGMLQSDKIKLLAAFNHVHIFVDPNPDVQISYTERDRLFNLPNSTWQDYNAELISPGGGVFARSAKKIILSKEMQELFRVNQDSMEPNEMIRAILTLKVDLFFNGGIGTFVKATNERNADVGDRANDVIRINGNQLCARVVCEGGNLGFTQLARVEYAQTGGKINTDAIDNSGGVNCSDNEVNIKILLNEIIIAGDLTEHQRNELLVSMTDEVAKLVLANNRKQNCALILTESQAKENLQMHYRLLQELERDAGLDPAVEYLPDGEKINLRVSNKQGFVRPELAVLMAYTKNYLKKELLSSTLLDEDYVEKDLIYYFPRVLQAKKFIPYIKQHRLKREIIATRISNYIVNEMGINFIQRLIEETGADSSRIARAYMIAREIFDVKKILKQTWDLSCSVSVSAQLLIWQDLNRLIRRTTRWFVINVPADAQISAAIAKYKPAIEEIEHNLENIVQGSWLDNLLQYRDKLLTLGVPVDLASRAAHFSALYSAPDIVEAALKNSFAIEDVGKIYFALGKRLNLDLFGDLIKKQPVTNHWEALSRSAFRDDIDKQQCDLAINIIQNTKDFKGSIDERIEYWLTQHDNLLQRWEFFINEFKTSEPEFTMFAVALRELKIVS